MIKDIVVRAYRFAEKAHRGQKRKYTNLPYFTHPKAVARMVEDLGGTPDMVAAALLHDVVEDCGVRPQQLIDKFNLEIGDMVALLTNSKFVQGCYSSKGHYLAAKMNSMSDELLLIKLADVLHNVQHLNADGVPVAFVRKQYFKVATILNALDTRVSSMPKHAILYKFIGTHLDYFREKHQWE